MVIKQARKLISVAKPGFNEIRLILVLKSVKKGKYPERSILIKFKNR